MVHDDMISPIVMRKFFKLTATFILISLSLVVLLDSYLCEEVKLQGKGSPVDCCVMCCPNHNLAPPTVSQSQISAPAFFQNFSLPKFFSNPALLADSVFHPPRA